MRASAVRCTSESWRLRYSIRSAMVAIFRSWRAANSSRSGSRAMVPSSRRISQMTPAGAKPARRARSTAPSVCPARTSTPPHRARSGKTCPGLTMSAGVASAPLAGRVARAASRATTYGLWRGGDIGFSDDRRGVGPGPALARVLFPDLRGREDVLGNDGQAGEARGLERRGPGMRACDPPPARLEDALLDRPPLEVDEPQLAHAEGRVRVRFRGPIVGGGPGGERFDHEVRRVEATRLRRSQPLP